MIVASTLLGRRRMPTEARLQEAHDTIHAAHDLGALHDTPIAV
jgi:hypothetical protein